MQFDDRLDTVLRAAAVGEAGARTQFRQLLDLLGSLPPRASGELVAQAYDRLGELCVVLPATEQSAILRAPGLRLRNRALVAWLARAEPQAAAAAMASAQLSEDDWLYLIPRLPLTARGYLRHRRGMSAPVRQLLDRLGVGDLVLPQPAASPGAATERELRPEPEAEQPGRAGEAETGIGALVRRIEAFQSARRAAPAASPDVAVEDVVAEPHPAGLAFDFATDAHGAVNWADPAVAPLVVGMTLAGERPGSVAWLDPAGARGLARHLPLRAATATIDAGEAISGKWRVDAAPEFALEDGSYLGHRGRMRRHPQVHERADAEQAGDRVRQLLHELRTPVNAIQGFAELIQQQMFGPAPNAYRALAAAVAVDAARVMAGFDEIDRLARLEAGTLELESGSSDVRDAASVTLRRLEGALRARGARIDLRMHGGALVVDMSEADLMQVVWRLLATLAGALAGGEIVEVSITGETATVIIEADLPAALAGQADLFAAAAGLQPPPISAGMFGTGFALRLARAEARSAGGDLAARSGRLRLVLPLLARDESGAAHAGGSPAA